MVSQSEWLRARRDLLAKEKELTRQSDELARLRLELPWTRVEKDYVFDGPKGKVRLADLFEGRSQLAVYHFMLGPDWVEGCPGCSFMIDHLNGTLEHVRRRDVSLVLVSRGSLANIVAFNKRMGWRLPWVSTAGNDFNHDFGVSFTPDEVASGAKTYNFGAAAVRRRKPGPQLFLQGCERHGLSHLLDVRPRSRRILDHLRPSRPRRRAATRRGSIRRWAGCGTTININRPCKSVDHVATAKIIERLGTRRAGAEHTGRVLLPRQQT